MVENRVVELSYILGSQETLRFDYNPPTSVLQLIRELRNRLNRPHSEFALFHNNECLLDYIKLWDLGIPLKMKYLELELFNVGHRLKVFDSDLATVFLNDDNTIIKQYTIQDEWKLHQYKILLDEIISFSKLTENPNVVQLMGFYKREESENKIYFYIRLEYMDKGNLEEQMTRKGRPINEDKALEIMKVIVEVLIDMHSRKIIHRGLRCSSIYKNSNKEIKLANFGFSKYQDGITTDDFLKVMPLSVPRGPVNWLSPEILNREEYNYKVDIWGVGVTLIEMLTGKRPFHSVSEYEAEMSIKQGRPIPYETDNELDDKTERIIKLCTKFDLNERPDANELANEF